MTRTSLLVLTLASGLTAACGGPKMDVDAMTAARPVDFGGPAAALQGQYRIGPGDELNVRVFQVEDLSFEKINVDAAGDLQMPLIGAVRAAGRTPVELASDIAGRLSSQYLRNPQVTVTVNEAASQKITVDGAVTKPGVYTMRGSTSLLQAVAMAEGPNRTADLTKVAVFRNIEGQRSVALFDLQAIRQGRADDPRVLGDDVIVVDTSQTSAIMREIIGALPALAIFRPY